MIEIGLKHTSELTVIDAVTAVKMGSGDMPVLATPAMMALMENAAMLAVANELPEVVLLLVVISNHHILNPRRLATRYQQQPRLPRLMVRKSSSKCQPILAMHYLARAHTLDSLLIENVLCPKFFLACLFHLALALRASVLIPNPDVIAATLQTQSAHLASVRRSHIGNYATNNNVLDGLAVRACHGRNLLPEEPAPLVHLSLIAALLTAIFQFPSHLVIQIPSQRYTIKT